jgi:hypothetical protein
MTEFNEWSEKVGEFLRDKGIPLSDLTIMWDDDAFIEDMASYYEEMTPEEYGDMLLNQWSGVPRYDDRGLVSESLDEFLSEGILSKKKPKRITDGAPMNKLVDVLDMIEHEGEMERIDAIYILEKNMKYIKELINRRYNTYEIYHKLKEVNLI